MKQVLTQLMITLLTMGAVGCGSEGSGKIVTPTGQTISTSPSTQAPAITAITTNKPQSQINTSTQTPSSNTTSGTGSATQTNITAATATPPTPLPVPTPTPVAAPEPATNSYKELVAILEASGGFMKYGNITMIDYDEANDGTVTVLFEVTNDLASGSATFTAQYNYVLSADGKTSTMKPILNKFEMNNFKYESKCLGEVTLSGKVESDGWQITHTDTKLYDFEHLYSTSNSPSTVISLNMAGGSHSVKLSNAKISAKDKKAEDLSSTQFGTGFIYDGKEVDMTSQLQDAINAGCIGTKS